MRGRLTELGGIEAREARGMNTDTGRGMGRAKAGRHGLSEFRRGTCK